MLLEQHCCVVEELLRLCMLAALDGDLRKPHQTPALLDGTAFTLCPVLTGPIVDLRLVDAPQPERQRPSKPVDGAHSSRVHVDARPRSDLLVKCPCGVV